MNITSSVSSFERRDQRVAQTGVACAFANARTILAAAVVLASHARADAPVVPAPGQSVTWTLAQSPIEITGNVTIPGGSTVFVEPGVEIEFAPLARLFVDGSFTAVGTATQRVALTGSNSGWLVARGDVEIVHGRIAAGLAQGGGSRIFVRHCAFEAGAYLTTSQVDGPLRALVEDSTSVMPLFTWTGEVRLSNVHVTGGAVDLLGLVITDGLVSDGARVRLRTGLQPALVEGLAITGVNAAALQLDGESDQLVDASVSLIGNEYPVELLGSGLHRESVLPTSGNTNDAILAFGGGADVHGHVSLPHLALPYHLDKSATVFGRVDIDPGVRFEVGPLGGMTIRSSFFSDSGDLRGLPGTPIVFEPRFAGQKWNAFAFVSNAWLVENVVFRGATQALTASTGAQLRVLDCVFEDCLLGMQSSGLGNLEVLGSRFLNNTIGASGATSILNNGLDLTGYTRPNSFRGNTLAVDKPNTSGTPIAARGNWWGHPSGPHQTIQYPSGLGAEVDFGVDATDFLVAPPALTDTPPAVRMVDPFFVARPGDLLLVNWSASDDVGIVSQSVEIDLSGGGASAFMTVVSGLPGDARSAAFVVPQPGFNVAARLVRLRVTALDTLGQVGFDESSLHVTSSNHTGTFAFDVDLDRTFEPLERFDVCWNAVGLPGPMRVHLVLDADERVAVGPAGPQGSGCSYSEFVVPYVSTDSARLAIHSDGQGNADEWHFSEPFAIRPDALLGDQPPSIAMLAPLAGTHLPAGSETTIAWSATDDDPLRAIKVQVSLNGGHSWTTIARDLPGDATDFVWRTPAGIDAPDVRFQVVAIDRRFQNSSDGRERVVSIDTTGWASWPGCFGNSARLVEPSHPAHLDWIVSVGIESPTVTTGLAATFRGALGVGADGCGIALAPGVEMLLALTPQPVLFALTSVENGAGSVVFSVPSVPALVGVEVALQSVVIDPSTFASAATDVLVFDVRP